MQTDRAMARPLPRVAFEIRVRGVKAMAVDLTDVEAGDSVELVAEPDNRWDPNAVRIEWRGHLIGYVQRAVAARMAGEVADWRGVVSRTISVPRTWGTIGGLRVVVAPVGNAAS